MSAACLVFVTGGLSGEPPVWQWARTAGGTNWDRGGSVVVSSMGFVYASGGYDRKATFDWTNLTSSGEQTFLARYNPLGELLWVRQPEGPAEVGGYQMLTDAGGNVYSVGKFTETAVFGDFTLTSASLAMFIVKYDSLGRVLWAQHCTNVYDESWPAMAVDAEGNLYISQAFYGTTSIGGHLLYSTQLDLFVAKIDGDGHVHWVAQGDGQEVVPYDLVVDARGCVTIAGTFAGGPATFGRFSLSNEGSYDAFVVRFEKDGRVAWAWRAGGGDSDNAWRLALNDIGGIHVAGSFRGSARFGTNALTSVGEYDVFLAKLDSNGEVAWATQVSASSSCGIGEVLVDETGAAYLSGHYYGILTLGTDVLTSETYYGNPFLARFDRFGNPLWVRHVSGNSLKGASELALDAAQNVYLAGSFSATISIGHFTLSNVPYYSHNAYVAQFDRDGNVNWALATTGSSREALGWAVTPAGEIYCVGSYTETIAFDSQPITSRGETDMFLAKLGSSDLSPVIIVDPQGVTAPIGGRAEIEVVATGAWPLNYHWYFRGNAIPGATNATLVINNVQAADAGEYSVIVYNAYGSVDSATAVLQAIDAEPSWEWARSGGGQAADLGYTVAMDGVGNVFVAGTFYEYAKFEDWSLNTESASGLFVARYDAAGRLEWVQQALGDPEFAGTMDSLADPAGNFWLAGRFHGNATLGDHTIQSGTYEDLFFAKFAPDGQVLWAISGPKTDPDSSPILRIDVEGRVFAAAAFFGSGKLGGQELTNEGYNVLVTQLEPTGEVGWMQTATGIWTSWNGFALAVDPAGNVFFGGVFRNSASFGSLNFTNPADMALLLVKCDSSGHPLWASQVGDPDLKIDSEQVSLAVSSGGGAYMLSGFRGTGWIGNFRLSNRGWMDTMVIKFSSVGNVLWANQAGGRLWDSPGELAVDAADNCYMLGHFGGPWEISSTDGRWMSNGIAGSGIIKYASDGTAEWHRAAFGHKIAAASGGGVYLLGDIHTTTVLDSFTLMSAGEGDVCLARLNEAGIALWAVRGGGPGEDFACAWAIGSSGDICVTGEFESESIFGSDQLFSHGGYDALVAKIHAGLPPQSVRVLPLALTRFVGEPATFGQETTLPPPLTYQWLFNGNPVTGLTNPVLSLASVQFRDEGRYAVAVSSPAGSLVSPDAFLTVLPKDTGSVTLDTVFDAGSGTDGYVTALASAPNGQLLIAGRFTNVNGMVRRAVARLHSDGTVDASFNFKPNSNAQIYPCTVAVQADGKVLLGGWWYYITPSGSVPQGIMRLNSDGAVDTSFTAGAGAVDSESVYCIVVQPDGKILVGGDFNYMHGIRRSGIARLMADGTLDNAFQPVHLRAGDSDGVFAIVVQPDGKILIGGSFSNTNCPRDVARLNADGSLDTSFDPTGAFVSGSVRALALQADGRVVVGGHSIQFGEGRACYSLLRLNPDGSRDPTFQPQVLGWDVTALALQPDRKILANSYNTGPMRLHTDGSLDATFAVDITGSVYALGLQPDWKIAIGGQFTAVNSVPRRNIALLKNNVVLPFVQRQITQAHIQLLARPAPGVSVYAVEDQPPADWAVRNASHDSVLDVLTGKVKFGPFFDHEARTLSYEVVPPPAARGLFTFSGAASADGASTPIAGDFYFFVPGCHPADLNPGEWMLDMNEMTGYAAAWRGGNWWPLDPVPIPIDYVTRAAALWRGGECYTVQPTITNAPMCWVNCPAPQRHSGQDNRQVGTGCRAIRQIATSYVPLEPLMVTITVAPAASIAAYALEDRFPAGWTVDVISHNGEVDAVNGKIKWGPFLDDLSREFSYRVTSPFSANGSVRFEGLSSFDGTTVLVAGPDEVTASCRLSISYSAGSGSLRLAVVGPVNGRVIVEASNDLVHWEQVAEITNPDESIEFSDPDGMGQAHRFYRCRIVE